MLKQRLRLMLKKKQLKKLNTSKLLRRLLRKLKLLKRKNSLSKKES
jgi:hypothetical protein